MVGVFGFTQDSDIISYPISMKLSGMLICMKFSVPVDYRHDLSCISDFGVKNSNFFCENKIKIHKKLISCTNFLDRYRLARGTLNLLAVCLFVCPSVGVPITFQFSRLFLGHPLRY